MVDINGPLLCHFFLQRKRFAGGFFVFYTLQKYRNNHSFNKLATTRFYTISYTRDIKLIVNLILILKLVFKF